MSPLIVIRAQPGADRSVARARTMGLSAEADPLFVAHALGWSPPDPADYDGLIVGSARVFELGGPKLEVLRSLPVHAVGPVTAAAAARAGFEVAGEGDRDLAFLMRRIPPDVRLLRLAGRDHIASQDPRIGATLFLYAVDALPIGPVLARQLERGAIVALHSLRGARHLAKQTVQLGLTRRNIALAAISQAVAEAAGKGWAAVAVASEPRDAALLCRAAALARVGFGPKEGG